MPRALWLLLWMRFRAWLRRLGSKLRTVKGALLALLGVFLGSLWLFSIMLAPAASQPVDPESVRRFGPLVLFAYCLLALLTPASERVISFTPAEVNFLFPGPFSRRQLLGYKIVSALLTSLLGALVLMLWLRTYTPWVVAGVVGVLLFLVFQQLLLMVVALATIALGEHAFNRPRQLLLAALALLALGLWLPLGRQVLSLAPLELLNRVEQAPALQVVLAPMRWFVEAFTAERLWPDLVLATLRGLAVNGLFLALVFLLDAHYLEAAASASERLYARLQRMRSGGGVAGAWATPGTVRLQVPELPWWGGAGPIAWRQLTTAVRSLRSVVMVLIIFGAFMLWPLMLTPEMRHDDSELPLVLAGMTLGMTTFFLISVITCDFRGDIDRFDVLKSLPVRPAFLVLGQLAAPVLLCSVVQFVFLLILQLALGGVAWLLLPAAAFVIPVNALLLAIENLMFLWFPTRQLASAGADFEVIGRYSLLLLAKGLLMMCCAGVITLVVTTVFFVVTLLEGPALLAALVAGWLALVGTVGTVACLLPLLALAFQHFDVVRDTPP